MWRGSPDEREDALCFSHSLPLTGRHAYGNPDPARNRHRTFAHASAPHAGRCATNGQREILRLSFMGIPQIEVHGFFFGLANVFSKITGDAFAASTAVVLNFNHVDLHFLGHEAPLA